MKNCFIFGTVASCLFDSILADPEVVTVNVHFVSHSHMDAGWLRTYDEYYDHNVQYIFDSVFEEL